MRALCNTTLVALVLVAYVVAAASACTDAEDSSQPSATSADEQADESPSEPEEPVEEDPEEEAEVVGTVELHLLVREIGDRKCAYLIGHLGTLQRIAQTHGIAPEAPVSPDLERRMTELSDALTQRREWLSEHAEHLLEQSVPLLTQRLEQAGFDTATLEIVATNGAQQDSGEAQPHPPMPFETLSTRTLAKLVVTVPYTSRWRASTLVPRLQELLTRPGCIELRLEADSEAKQQQQRYISATEEARTANNLTPLTLRWRPVVRDAAEQGWGRDGYDRAWIMLDYEAAPLFETHHIADIQDNNGGATLVLDPAHAQTIRERLADRQEQRLCLVIDERVDWIGKLEWVDESRLHIAASERVIWHLTKTFRNGKLPLNIELGRVRTIAPQPDPAD